MARFPGTPGRDTLNGTSDDDVFIGRGGGDSINGRSGNDRSLYDVTTDGPDRVNLGVGSDVVRVSGDGVSQVRLTFTSAEVGNGSVVDSNTMANQDGGFAVRMRAENDAGGMVGALSRYDDEGITFVAAGGLTFDVRDLVSGVRRGDGFEVVRLGTGSADTFDESDEDRAYYINAGGGRDVVTGGDAMDFLVGGRGQDLLDGGDGGDSLLGGAGNDRLFGGSGKDTAIVNLSTDGADRTDLGIAQDAVTVSANAPGEVRLTFTSAEVGNFKANDSGSLANQDGGLAVRMSLEDGSDALTGPVSRYDDEGITFVAGAGLTFDVRDLVSGVQRGDTFEVVTLGTVGADVLGAVQAMSPYYFNGGRGNDQITGGKADDFLVGGVGNDVLVGRGGDDKFIGGAGDDTIRGDVGTDTAIYSSNSANATITRDGRTVTVVSADGTDTYSSVERFQFSDRVISIDDLMV